MSLRQSSNHLPRQTPFPIPPTRQSRLKRRLSSAHSVAPSATTSKYARQVLADQSQIGSCFPFFFIPLTNPSNSRSRKSVPISLREQYHLLLSYKHNNHPPARMGNIRLYVPWSIYAISSLSTFSQGTLVYLSTNIQNW